MSSEDTKRQASRISRRLFFASGAATASSFFVGMLKASGQPLPKKTAIDVRALKSRFKGEVVIPGDPDFAKFVYGGLWNRLYPNRAPQIVARVANEQDVVEAVKFAKKNKLKVAVRGGGHNWCAPSVRNSGMMIDLTNLDQVISINPETRKAVVQPIISNREMQAKLKPYNLAYPTGHCPPVKLSGYLLSGGMAWNQGVWGPGIGSVEAVELVTPDGELLTANKEQNTDYYWAARGAGPGLFAVATRYHLKLYPLPKVITASSYYYPIDQLGTVAQWLGDIASKLPSNVELSLFLLTAPPELAEQCKDSAGKVCMVTATVFADLDDEAKAAVKPLDECPIIDKCLAKTVNQSVDFERLFDMSGALWPDERRNKVDAMFSNANLADLFNAVIAHFLKSPSPETVVMFAIFTGANIPAPLPDAAFSMSAHFYGGTWTMWKDAQDDAANIEWHHECVKLLKPFVVGHYVCESDTVDYPEFATEAYSARNWKRIEELRSKYDPDGVFFSYTDGLS